MVQILPEAQRRPSTAERFSEAIGAGLNMLGQHSARKQQQQALSQMNIDPAVLNLPEAGQVAYFKSKFPSQINPLQQAQQRLAEQKALQAESRRTYFDQLMGEQQPGQRQQIQPGQMPQDQTGFNLASMDENRLRNLSAFAGQPGDEGVVGNMAKSEIERREKEEARTFEREKLARKEETEISKPILLEMNEIRKNIPLQEQAIEDIQNASPDVGALDFIADVTGFEPLRTSSGAKLKTAIKDFFLSDLSRAGARPNMWIEQQLADALPKIGRSKEANLITAAGMKFKVDLAKKRMEIIDKLSELDRRKHGFVKADIDSRAFENMKKYVIDRQKELKEEIELIKSKKELTTDILDKFLEKSKDDPEKAAEMARKAGYIW